MSARSLGPLGFLLLMVGFGLRLDSGWQWTAHATLVAGGIVSLVSLRATRAFVPGGNGR